MSAWDQGALDQMFGSGGSKKSPSGKEPLGKLAKLALFFAGQLILLYPFTILGLPLTFVAKHFAEKERKDHLGELAYIPFFKRTGNLFIKGAMITFVLNSLLAWKVMPTAYLSCYLLFPMRFFMPDLHFTFSSFIALVLGSLCQGLIILSVYSFVAKRKVKSKAKEMEEIKASSEYQERKENKFDVAKSAYETFEQEYKEAIASNDEERINAFDDLVFVGVDEFGKTFIMNFSELNQHGLFSGTTGSGKTTLNMIFVNYAAQHNIPIVYLDGKGAQDTLTSIQKIAEQNNKKLKVFSDTNNVRYNPIKYGNSVMVRDRMISLANTESEFYSSAAKSLLQGTVKLLDTFEIQRTFEHLSDHFLPRTVLMLFLQDLLEMKPSLLFRPVEEEPPKKKKSTKKDKKAKKASVKEDELEEDLFAKINDIESEINREMNELSEEEVAIADEIDDSMEREEDKITWEELDPERLDLESLYSIIRSKIDLFNEHDQPKKYRLFKELFMRYEHKENPFYLYATSEALQTNINMLLDSELGDLFDTTDPTNEELDLLEDTKNGEIIFITLNGLVYSDYIKTIAQFIISDINYLASTKYLYSEFFPLLLVCDEPSVYLNDSFLDSVNKGRGAGLHTIFSPQMLADVDRIDPLLRKQLVGNCNTYFIGQGNDEDEYDIWTGKIGTYADIETTQMTQQEHGYSDVEKTDWIGERGTVRGVHSFTIHPDDLRDIRQGEFVVYRKAKSIREQAKRVYAANPTKRGESNE